MDYRIVLDGLQRKRMELETALEAIDETFEELNLSIHTVAAQVPTGLEEKQEIQRAGIRIHGQLSFRGEDKAREYFALLDRHRRGVITYEDLRGTKALILFLTFSSAIFTLRICPRSDGGIQ